MVKKNRRQPFHCEKEKQNKTWCGMHFGLFISSGFNSILYNEWKFFIHISIGIPKGRCRYHGKIVVIKMYTQCVRIFFFFFLEDNPKMELGFYSTLKKKLH